MTSKNLPASSSSDLFAGGSPAVDFELPLQGVSQSLFHHLSSVAARDPDRTYCVTPAGRFSARDMLAHANRLAAGLAAIGLTRGDRVALMLPNSHDQIALIFAIAKLGLVWLPLNMKARGEHLAYQMEHAAPRIIVAAVECAADLLPALPLENAPAVYWYGDSEQPCAGNFSQFLSAGVHAGDGLAQVTDLLSILYTSGTTGRPKGVLLTHRMLAFASYGITPLCDLRDGDVLFVWEPIYHIGGSQLLLLPLIRRAHLAFVARFSASQFWQQVRALGATQIHHLGGIQQMLLKQPPRSDDRDHPVRVCWGGGCPKEVWEPFEERFGVRVQEGYGMTECSSIALVNNDGIPGPVGKRLPWVDVFIADETGQRLGPGVMGEIVISPRLDGIIFSGYLNDPVASSAALRDGVLYTGDLGSYDAQGYFYFHGRKSDSVRHKGENVSAWEVEHIVNKHPDVQECAMVGVPGEVGEQDIKLFVRQKEGHHLDFNALARWCCERMASYQVPRYYALVEAFEKTPSERIAKKNLDRTKAGAWDRLAR